MLRITKVVAKYSKKFLKFFFFSVHVYFRKSIKDESNTISFIKQLKDFNCCN